MIDKLLYLDREYISNQYEMITHSSPIVKITKTEGIKAGVRIPLFSAGATSTESKTFELSTNAMLDKISDKLQEKAEFSASTHNVGQHSRYCWVAGKMTVSKITLTRNKYTLTLIGKPKENNSPSEEVISEESYFSIKDINENKFSLLAKGDYFSSGIESIIELSDTVTSEVLFPVRALLRVLPVKSSLDSWASVPLIIYEN